MRCFCQPLCLLCTCMVHAAAPYQSNLAHWTSTLFNAEESVLSSALQSAGACHMQLTAQHGCGACLAFAVCVACRADVDGFSLVQVPRVTWADVGGLDDVKLRLQEAVQWPHLHPKALERLGASPPRGQPLHCLLHTAHPKAAHWGA